MITVWKDTVESRAISFLDFISKKKSQRDQDRGSGQHLCFREGSIKEEKFPHTQKPLMEGGAGGELQNLRGEHNGGGSEGKMERTHCTGHCPKALPAKKWLSCP